MKKTIIQVLSACMLSSLLIVPQAAGQTTSSSATEAGASSGVPSSLTIRSNFLTIKQGSLQRELRAIRRCLKNATLTLRDPQGRINRVPETDLVNCGRRLRQVQRQLQVLGREFTFLSQDAAALAIRFQQLQERQEFLSRTQMGAGG
jgi:chromosome segregation ATPase